MTRKIILLSLMCAFAFVIVGCVVATVTVRQDDGTHKTSREIIWWSSDSWRSFECQKDYMVASDFQGVTYEWPTGKGHMPDLQTITFEGEGIECVVKNRTMILNDNKYGAFKEGDKVRITPDAKVLVNDVEHPPADGE